MAYLHVLRAASYLLDPGATYSHRGAIGFLNGVRAVIRLVYLDRSIPGAAHELWWTRVELGLSPDAPVGVSIEEVDGEDAAWVRNTWTDELVDVAQFGERFRVTIPDGSKTAWSERVRERLLRHPSLSVRTVAAVALEDGADPVGTTDGAAAGPHLAGCPVLVVESPGISEAEEDLVNLLEVAALIRDELVSRGV